MKKGSSVSPKKRLPKPINDFLKQKLPLVKNQTWLIMDEAIRNSQGACPIVAVAKVLRIRKAYKENYWEVASKLNLDMPSALIIATASDMGGRSEIRSEIKRVLKLDARKRK